ncbi:hypothetical protein E8E11_009756 [Didymella keratinophila]|nr:hypothetical protein E8E11_009756 [Didymella keratinophila]
MGNTPSTPPPLVSINAPGNDVLVPYGTSLYACPPAATGVHPPNHHSPCPHIEHTGAICQHCQSAPQGPVYSRIPTRSQRRHGHPEPDVRIREYDEESSSTELGSVRMRREKGGKMADMRRRYDIDPRPSSAPAGYAGLRGGQAGPGTCGSDEMGQNGMHQYAGMYPQMYPGVYPQGPGMSPHASVPPQYASHESMPGYAHPQRNGNVYASHPPRPPPPSVTSTSSSSKSRSRSRPLPSAIQAAINVAIQKSTGATGGSSYPLSRSKTSPAIYIKDSNNKDRWGDGMDTCICTTNCKCRKGERAVKWYEGMADIGGKEVPVRAKLNTRIVLKDDIGKDCGDHSGCKKKTDLDSSSSSSSSDTETSTSKRKKKSKKVAKPEKAGKLDDLQAELEKLTQAEAMKQGGSYGPYGPSPFTGYGSGPFEGHGPETMSRMMEMRDPYRMGRMGRMDPTAKMQAKDVESQSRQ